MNIYQYIAENRKALHRSAKAFWRNSGAPFSYEYYANIERGTKFPNIKTVLFLCDKLKLNKKQACFLWAMEAMPDNETRSFFRWDADSFDSVVPLGSQISLDNTLIISERHRKLLETSPFYWAVMSFFSTNIETYFSLQEILDNLAIDRRNLLRILGDLVDNGLLVYQRKRYALPKRYVHVPNDERFFKLRNQNYSYTSTQILSMISPEAIKKNQAFRVSFSRRLMPAHVDRVARHLKFIVGDTLNLPYPEKTDKSSPYSLCLLFGERDFKKPVVPG